MASDYALASPLDVDEDASFTINQLKRGPSSSFVERYSETVREWVATVITGTWVLAFLGFVIACCAMAGVNNGPGHFGHGPDDHWEMRCQKLGTSLYGDDVFHFGGHHYQVVGGHWAKMSWKAAEMDAWSRCFKGKAGKLAMVNSKEENELLMARMRSHHGFQSTDAAWLGGADLEEEGTWQWIGESGSLNGDKFYKNGSPSKGQYNNWRANEPNNNGNEDCLKMDPDGQWTDDNCYKQQQYFFVEFDQ